MALRPITARDRLYLEVKDLRHRLDTILREYEDELAAESGTPAAGQKGTFTPIRLAKPGVRGRHAAHD